jgi:hypothetical protein
MEVIGVAFHWTPARQAQWQGWADQLGAELTLLHTHPDRQEHPYFVGNDHFEFGAYARASDHARTSGPFVVVNDTLLDRHASGLWARWLLATSNWLQTPGVYCDVYPAPRERPAEIPDPYASSWIFYLPSQTDLREFSAAVRRTLESSVSGESAKYATAATPEPSPAYEAFLRRWLYHPLPGVGYQGPRSPADLARKRQTIIWEHALSRELQSLGFLRPFQGWLYRFIRFVDRLLRRLQTVRRGRAHG